MEYVHHAIDFVLHLNKHLGELASQYGVWTNLILFAIVFAETGLVFTPFLPGDSLLFAAGTLVGSGDLTFGFSTKLLNLALLFVVLSAAAILGDTANYWIGKVFGHKIVAAGNGRFVKKEHLDRTHAFFEKYGGKTIIIARFVPIVRTFAPFVAGIGEMTYGKFLTYNVVGGILWVAICMVLGYGFGGLKVVQDNFSLVILAIIIISILPAIFEIVRARRNSAAAPTGGGEH